MPLTKKIRKREPVHAREQEEAKPAAKRPVLQPAGRRPVKRGLPYRAYVEDEARKYWRDMVDNGSLVKPDRQEIRTGAFSILCRAQRSRPGRKLNPALNRAQMAADAMHLHAAEKRWIKPPYSRPQTCNNYVEALIQLVDDAGWLAREIPLPEHPAPRHPPIYYLVDPESNKPVPREDALLRGDYVHTLSGARITGDRYIHPWRDTKNFPSKAGMVELGQDACYSLVYDPRIDDVAIQIDWLGPTGHNLRYNISPLTGFIFSPPPNSRDQTRADR